MKSVGPWARERNQSVAVLCDDANSTEDESAKALPWQLTSPYRRGGLSRPIWLLMLLRPNKRRSLLPSPLLLRSLAEGGGLCRVAPPVDPAGWLARRRLTLRLMVGAEQLARGRGGRQRSRRVIAEHSAGDEDACEGMTNPEGCTKRQSSSRVRGREFRSFLRWPRRP